jgi:hypothetical protein
MGFLRRARQEFGDKRLTLRLWDIESGAELDYYVGDAAFTALAPTPDVHHVLTGNAIGQVVPFWLPD